VTDIPTLVLIVGAGVAYLAAIVFIAKSMKMVSEDPDPTDPYDIWKDHD